MPLPQRPFQPEHGPGTGPYKPPVGKSTIQGSPGLLTSTGGIGGVNPFLLMPVFDSIAGKTYLAYINPADANTEDDAFYTFRQEDVMPGRKVSIHRLLVFYREMGIATFNIGVQVYINESDEYKTITKPVKITPGPKRKFTNFPDFRIRMKKVSLVIDGERPQLFISRIANSGPISITRVIMCGKADEGPQV